MKSMISKLNRKSGRIAACFALSAALVAGLAQAAMHGAGNLTFHAKGPLGLSIDGKGPVEVKEENGVLKFTALFSKLDSGMETRNKHMRERMHADKHPTVAFEVERSKLKMPTDGQPVVVEKKDNVVGKVTMNNISKPAVLSYKAKKEAGQFVVVGSIDVNLFQHGIVKKDICELGVCAEPDVHIEVKIKIAE